MELEKIAFQAMHRVPESNPFSGFSESRCARLGAADWQTNRGSKQWPNKA
jgi:hypothetical protein